MNPNPDTIGSKKEIMKRFDELVDAYGWAGDLANDGKDKFIKDFIISAIDEAVKEERNRVRKIVEGMKLKAKEPYLSDKCQYCHEWLEGCVCPNFNQAIDDILSQLERKEE